MSSFDCLIAEKIQTLLRKDVSERGQKHLFNGLVRWSHTITECCRLGVCMHTPHWIRPLTHTYVHTEFFFFFLYLYLSPLWHPAWITPRHGQVCVCVMWEAGVCHLVWVSRQKRAETGKRETKLDVASVSGVASPWVRWAILIEGSERSAAPLVHKPLYRRPTSCFDGLLGLWGRCYPMTSVREEEEIEPSHRWISIQVSAVEMSTSSLNCLWIRSPKADQRYTPEKKEEDLW